jgi:hypothetical protein
MRHVLGAHRPGGGVEHGEDLLVSRAGDGRVSGCRRVGVAGQTEQRLAGDGEFGQFGLGRGELVGERGDLLAEPFRPSCQRRFRVR